MRKVAYCLIILGYILLFNNISAFNLLFNPARYGIPTSEAPPFYKFCGTVRYYHINSTALSAHSNIVASAFSSWNNVCDINFYTSISSGIEIGEYNDQTSDNPGRTDTSTDGYKIIDSNSSIELNTRFTWGYNGVQHIDQDFIDVEAILLHEIGHLVGLAHPDTTDYVHDATAPIMAGGDNKYFDNYAATILRSDDINGSTWLDEHAMVPEHYTSITNALNSFNSVGEVFISFSRGYTIQDNISLASGKTLTITNNCKLNLSSYKILTNGGTVNIESGSSISPQIIRKEGTILKGYYPSILSAINDASSGETIEIYDTYTLSADITIPSGITLKFVSGEGLEINGKITANGNPQNPIIFTSISGTWDGLDLVNASSNSVFNFCEIKNATNGLYLDNSSPTIQNCYIHDNTYDGIRIFNTSDPVLVYNSIKDNGYYGVNCYNYSEPSFCSGGYNVITGNNNGIVSSYDSFVELGYYTGSGNTIYNNTYDNAIAIYGGEIIAQGCWWGSSDTNDFVDKFETGIVGDASEGSLYWQYYLTSNPGGGSSLGKASSGVDQEVVFDPKNVDENNPEELYNLVLYYKAQDNTSGLIKIAEDIVERFPESKFAEKAICRIFHANERKNLDGLKSFLTQQSKRKLNNDLQGTIINLLISKYIREKEYEKAQTLCQETLDEPLNIQNELFAYYNMISLNKNNLGKASEAKSHLNKMKSKYPNETMTLLACEMMGEEVDWSNTEKSLLSKQAINTENSLIIASEFQLYPAYPNPFNPSTTLSFSLEKQSKIDLKIYNIQGKEVWNWGNNLEYGSGYHSIVWNAVDKTGGQLSSGVYFIKLIVGNQVATQKVIFMK